MTGRTTKMGKREKERERLSPAECRGNNISISQWNRKKIVYTFNEYSLLVESIPGALY